VPTLTRTRSFAHTTAEWLNRLPAAVLIVATGMLLGQQYVHPHKRVVPVMVAVLVFGLAWRIGMLSGLGVLLMALPYPKPTVFGSTNLALILLLLVIWLLRVSQGTSPAPRRTPVDVAIGGLLLAYVVSFYNVPDTWFLVRAVQNFELFFGCVLMFYLIVGNVRTRVDLQRFHHLMIASAVSVFLVAVLELNNPGTRFVQGWMDFSSTMGGEFNLRNVRVGSSFHDFELLSEYCAITLLMVAFQLLRAKSYGARVIYSGVLVLNLFVLFATVTRGAIISGACGLALLLWMTRRHLQVVPVAIAGVGSLLMLFGMNFYVAHYTRSGDMFKRLGETQVVQGWMPADRAEAWQNAWGRIMSHPIIGQGPFYWQVPGYKLWWPHNVYLYTANLVGFVGLAMFLWLLVGLWRLTRPGVDSLSHPDYARAYMLVARAQLVIFLVNEFKIDYLRNGIYQFVVWVMFASVVTGALIAQGEPEARAAARAAAPEPLTPAPQPA
jgi:O-antigen ligase/polysaccharide polymerase Wzy-like membrane protein